MVETNPMNLQPATIEKEALIRLPIHIAVTKSLLFFINQNAIFVKISLQSVKVRGINIPKQRLKN